MGFGVTGPRDWRHPSNPTFFPSKSLRSRCLLQWRGPVSFYEFERSILILGMGSIGKGKYLDPAIQLPACGGECTVGPMVAAGCEFVFSRLRI